MRGVLVLLLGWAAALGAAAKPDELVLALKPALLEDPARVPFVLEVEITSGAIAPPLVATQKPLAALLEGLVLQVEDEQLLVPGAEGRRATRIKAGRSAVVELRALERSIPVLFYERQGRWYAAPAALLVGRGKDHRLELLDADLDGRFDAPLDLLAWDGGALRVCEAQPLLPDEEGLRTLSLAESRKGPEARLLLEPLPEEADEDARRAWRTVNALRNGVGLAPVRLSVERCAATDAHAAYLQQNAADGGRGGFNVHAEDPALPGYSAAGARAARGNVGWSSGGRDLGGQPNYEFATLFHRGEFLYPSAEMGAGQDGGYNVVWVEESEEDLARWLGATRQGSHWVMVPGPGQREVPTTALRDSPVPASVPDFYSRSRGWPVSVSTSYRYHDFEDASLRVYGEDDKGVPGFVFTLADAGFLSAGFPADWIYASRTPLESGARYRAEFRATLKPGAAGRGARALAYDWSFTTGR